MAGSHIDVAYHLSQLGPELCSTIHWCLDTAIDIVPFVPVAQSPRPLTAVHIDFRFTEANEHHGLPLKVSPASTCNFLRGSIMAFNMPITSFG